MKHVDNRTYQKIKGWIKLLANQGKIPTHQQQKRSAIRKSYYDDIAKSFDLSYETIQVIGRSRSYPDYKDMQNWKKTAEDRSQDAMSVKIKNDTRSVVGSLRAEIADLRSQLVITKNDAKELTKDVDRLTSEMATIKSKKGKWFK